MILSVNRFHNAADPLIIPLPFSQERCRSSTASRRNYYDGTVPVAFGIPVRCYSATNKSGRGEGTHT